MIELELFVRLFTLFVYITFLYELVGIPVPSIASTYQLFFTKDEFDAPASLLARVRHWPLLLKIFLLIIPSGLVVLIYLLPLIQAIWPGFAEYLHFVAPPGIFWMSVVGIMFSLVGRYIGLSAAWMMYHEQAHANDKAQFGLKTRGLFSLTRNPILVGMYVTFIGLWFLYPTWEMGVGFLILVGNMHFRVLLEEEFLSWHFGVPYQEFVAKTRRYL